jgi:hypothetical protein
MVSVRAILSLAAPKLHRRIVKRFYRKGTAAPVLYAVLFVGGATLVILEGGIVVFALAFMTVGFLYDHLFAQFPEESAALVRAGEESRSRLWLFAYVVPWSILVGLAVGIIR